jgi:hypothetical protein
VSSLVKGIKTLIVANRGKVSRVDLKSERPDDDALAGMLLGPTGNLRAPTVKVGTTMLVGFDAKMYEAQFGSGTA